MYLAIDPGVSTGWAYFDADHKLVRCGAGDDVPPIEGHLSPVHVLVIERPQIYTARQMKGDPNDIVTLALQAGGYMYRFKAQGAKVVTVLPGEWKGQVPKDIHHPRIFKKLSLEEAAVCGLGGKGLGKKALADMMDAIGIGQYAVQMGMFVTRQTGLFK